MKNKLKSLFVLLIVLCAVLTTGCTTNWPKEGIVRGFHADPPRSYAIFVCGNYRIVDINKKPVYWLGIEAGGDTTSVIVPPSDYFTAVKDQPWKRTQFVYNHN